MHKEEIWWLNLNLSSNNKPRIFVLSTKEIEILQIDRSRSLLFINEGLDLIDVKLKRTCVFDQFITSLLWTSQFEIRFKSTLSDSTKLLIFLDESEEVELSPKRSRNDLRSKWHKSLINKEKSTQNLSLGDTDFQCFRPRSGTVKSCNTKTIW